MRPAGRGLVGALLAATLAAACGRTQPPRPVIQDPTVWSIILNITDTGATLRSATPLRGRETRADIEDYAGDLRAGRGIWLEYELHGATAGVSLATGGLPVLFGGIAEGRDGRGGGMVWHGSETVALVVPYSPELATISFRRAVPAEDPPARWARTPFGRVSFR